jgi:hypothetical protein
MYDAGVILEKKFSTHLEEAGGSSFVDFGKPISSHMSSVYDSATIRFENGYFWNIVPQGLRIGPDGGDKSNTLEFSLSEQNYMILTTATAFNFVPRSLSDEFFFNFLSRYRISFTVESGLIVIDCEQEMPTVHFLIGSYWVELNSRDMLIDISPDRDRSLCVCRFLPSTDEIWVLGQSLYKDYYMTHNPDQMTITFTPTEKRRKSAVEMGIKPEAAFQRGFSWITLGLKFLGMAAMSLGTFGLVQLFNLGTTISFLEKASLEEYKRKKTNVFQS